MTNHPDSQTNDDRVLVRGIHLELSPALRQSAAAKADHLFSHHDRIMRIRLDLERDPTRHPQKQYIAKGRLEISGPDLLASAESENAYKSLDLLVDKLDRLLRRRHRKRVNSRNDPRRLASNGFHGEC